MKKLLSFLLSIVMVLALFPANAFAAESTSEYDQLLDLACDIFPEYASLIRGESMPTSTFSHGYNSDEIVYKETRHISDNQSMSIFIASSGEVIVVDNNSSGQLDTEISGSTSSSIGSVGVTGSATFKVASTSWNYFFQLSNVQYTIYYTGSDYFTNYGTPYYQALYSIDVDEQSGTRIAYTLHVTSVYTQFRTFELYFANDQLVFSVS